MIFKFKAKTIKSNKWVRGTLFGDAILDETLNRKFKIDPATLCIYSNVNDKNGNEIYLNDFLRATFNEKRNILLCVIFSKGCFVATELDGDWEYSLNADQIYQICEVEHNIHD